MHCNEESLGNEKKKSVRRVAAGRSFFKKPFIISNLPDREAPSPLPRAPFPRPPYSRLRPRSRAFFGPYPPREARRLRLFVARREGAPRRAPRAPPPAPSPRRPRTAVSPRAQLCRLPPPRIARVVLVSSYRALRRDASDARERTTYVSCRRRARRRPLVRRSLAEAGERGGVVDLGVEGGASASAPGGVAGSVASAASAASASAAASAVAVAAAASASAGGFLGILGILGG